MDAPNIPSWLADAVEKLTQLAQDAAPNLTTFTVEDGKGGRLQVPIAVSAGDSGLRTISLLDEMQAAREAATKNRLGSAAGPDFRAGTAEHQSLASFIAHALRFKADYSAIWANPSARQLVSVLDYHPAGATTAPLWGRHRGRYCCPLSAAWVAWGGGKQLVLDQDTFAALLDKRDLDLASGTLLNGKPAPDPAALISLASNLEVYSTATAKRERDVNTGRVRISYSEDKGVSGAVMPPPAFLVLIPIFEDSPAQAIEVRLVVTVQEGHARFGLQIHAADGYLRNAFLELCERVKTETAMPVFVGVPEEAARLPS